MVTNTKTKDGGAGASEDEGKNVPTSVKAAAQAPAIPEEFDYGSDMGGGFENQTSEDVSVPFYEVLQPGSPEVQGEDGAKSGQIINRTTGEIWSGKDGIVFIPAYTEHVLVEWVPRDSGGGLVATHNIDSDLAKQVRADQPLGTYRHPTNGNDLVETFYVYGAFVGEGDVPAPGVIAFSSTKIKPYKDWMFRARSIIIPLPGGRKLTQVPLFSHRYRLRTVFIEKKGYKWYNWAVTFDGAKAEDARLAPTSELYLAARSVREAVSAGLARAATETLRQDEQRDPTPQAQDRDTKDAPY